MGCSRGKKIMLGRTSLCQTLSAIFGLHIIGPAPVEEDAERNTDLIVLRMANSRIAVRMRSYERIWKKWPNQITIRTERPTQHKTEYEKIIDGWGQYFFYGFGTEDGLLVHGFLAISRRFVTGSIGIKHSTPGESWASDAERGRYLFPCYELCRDSDFCHCARDNACPPIPSRPSQPLVETSESFSADRFCAGKTSAILARGYSLLTLWRKCCHE